MDDVPLEGHFVFRFDDVLCALSNAASGSPSRRGSARRCGSGAAHVVEQLAGSGEGRGGGSLPFDLQLPRGADGLLFALADHRDIVAAADDADEAGHIATEDSSIRCSVAPANGGRTLRAWTMRGSFMSTAHLNDPSTLAGMSYRLCDLADDAQVADRLHGSLAGRRRRRCVR